MHINQTSSDSFEHSRLADLVAVHQAIAVPGQTPDVAAVIEQCSVLYERVRTLHPCLVSAHEATALNLLIGSMAEVRKETLGA